MIVRPPGASSDHVSDLIDQTTIQETANEAGTGYSYVTRADVGIGAQVAVKANATFAGSLTAIVSADPY